MVKKLLTLFILITIGMSQIALAQTTFNVVTYNVLRFPNNSNTTSGGTNTDRLAAFQIIMEDINPDVVIVQELISVTGANNLLNTLNTSNLNKTFARTPNAPDDNFGTGGNMLFYNTALFTFISENSVPRSNTALAPNGFSVVRSPRSADIYRLNALSPATPGTTIPIYFVSTHLKAGYSNHSSDPSQIPDDDRRALGAKDIMDYVQQNLSSTDNIILVGDMNLRDENEPAYIDFTSNATYSNLFSDPLGPWTRDSQSSVPKFTQSTRVTGNAAGNAGAGGGLCDRFDFLLFNDRIINGSNGVAYKNNTMQVFGNINISVNQSVLNGTHLHRQQLYNFSDHLPVIAQFILDPSVVSGGTCTAYNIDTSQVMIEDFSGYSGQGFTDEPAPGQLCSNAWNFSGISDPYVFGGVNVGNDYARGGTNSGTSQGGIYEYNNSLWIQPTGADFTSGTATMEICNDTGNTIDSLQLSFDVLIFNDQNRSNKLDFDYSLNGTNYTYLPTMSQVSFGTASGTLNVFPKNINLYDLNILPDACFYLRWTGNDVSGSGSRDEFGLDNIIVNVLQAPAPLVCPPLLLVNDMPIANGLYKADTIISTGIIPLNGTVEFKGENCIQLDNGFIGEGDLKLEIEDCEQ